MNITHKQFSLLEDVTEVTLYSSHQSKQDTVEEMGKIMSETRKRKVHPPEFKAQV